MTHFIHHSKIIVAENRQRSEHDIEKHQELVTSISETAVGLQNAIVCRESSEGYILVSGERRLRAMRAIYALDGVFKYGGVMVEPDHIPVHLLSELDELEAEEAEFEENVRRVDLNWKERAMATQRLATLRQKQADLGQREPPTVASLGKDLGLSSEAGKGYQTINQQLAIIPHLSDPDVAAAKTLQEGFKIAQRKERDAKNQAVGKSIGGKLLREQHLLLKGDCITWMEGWEGEGFDCILTDPPYGMGADEFGDSGGLAAGSHFYKDDRESWLTLMEKFIPLTWNITKPNAHLYMFCDIDNFVHLKDSLADVGWKVFRTPLIWHKPQGNRAPWPNAGPQRKYETILYAVKGGKSTLRLAPDVLTYPSDSNLGHPAQKPIDLYTDLLSRSCLSGERVLDPFCGSGPIFPAAHKCKVYATGVEGDETAFGIAAKRIEELGDD